MLSGFWKELLLVGRSLKEIDTCWGEIGRNFCLLGGVWKALLSVGGS